MGLILTRREGWEERLAEVIEGARFRPYKLGEHDCFSFACEVILALTSTDLWSEWKGKYDTRQEAAKLIVRYARAGFTGAASRMFGVEPSPTPLARRGDIVEYRVKDKSHLGACVGTSIATPAIDGLRFIPKWMCAHAWRIG